MHQAMFHRSINIQTFHIFPWLIFEVTVLLEVLHLYSTMSHTTQEPQRVDSSRADAEWKADSGLGNIAHGADSAVGGRLL